MHNDLGFSGSERYSNGKIPKPPLSQQEKNMLSAEQTNRRKMLALQARDVRLDANYSDPRMNYGSMNPSVSQHDPNHHMIVGNEMKNRLDQMKANANGGMTGSNHHALDLNLSKQVTKNTDSVKLLGSKVTAVEEMMKSLQSSAVTNRNMDEILDVISQLSQTVEELQNRLISIEERTQALPNLEEVDSRCQKIYEQCYWFYGRVLQDTGLYLAPDSRDPVHKFNVGDCVLLFSPMQTRNETVYLRSHVVSHNGSFTEGYIPVLQNGTEIVGDFSSVPLPASAQTSQEAV